MFVGESVGVFKLGGEGERGLSSGFSSSEEVGGWESGFEEQQRGRFDSGRSPNLHRLSSAQPLGPREAGPLKHAPGSPI